MNKPFKKINKLRKLRQTIKQSLSVTKDEKEELKYMEKEFKIWKRSCDFNQSKLK